MRRFVLRGDLFTVYQITPTYFTIDPDWQAFLRIHGALDEQSRDSAEVIGVRESFLMSACQGILPSSNSSSRPHSGGSGKTPMSDREQLKHIHQRFYSALMLHDLIRERPWPEILQRFKVNRGTLQMLQLTASTFAGMLATFCQRLQWTNLQLLIHQFQERLSFGVCADLIDLCRLPSMRSSHARLLFERGYTTVGALAMASADSVAQILTLSRPYQPPSTNATSNATANATAKKTVMDARSINAMNALDRRLAATLVKEAVCLIKEEREMLAKQIGKIETNETSSDDEEEDSITNE